MATLAIAGGEKTVTRTLGKAWPVYDEREEKALIEVLHSGIWWRGGHSDWKTSKVGQFEDAFAAYQHAKYGVALTNGTAAIECALKALGIGAGDEVLVPALTFVASATAISLVGATPVFVDVDPESYNIRPDAMEAAITPRTKGAVVVHNGGYPADLDRIVEIAKRRGIRVVEDCAHAHGSEWKGRRVGAIGDIGTFSFQMGKTLTSGEGGIVVTDDQDLAEKAYSYHHIGRISGRPFYEFHRVASNLRMTEWQGAILLTQLSRLDEQTETRERNTQYLAKGLREIPGLAPINRDPRVTRWGFYYWNFKYHQDEFDGIHRNTFMKALQAEGVPIGVGAHGQPIYKNPVFRDENFKEVYCPDAERIFATEALSIGHRTFLGGQEDMDLILEAMRKVRANTAALKKIEEEKK